MADAARPQAIAIIGMAGRFPGAADVDALWRLVRDGVEVLEEPTEADLDAARVPRELRENSRYVRRCAPLDDFDRFDAAFFGYAPREAQAIDPQQRVFLECAWEALEDAGWAGAVSGEAAGVFAGAGMNAYLPMQLLANPGFVASVGAYQLMLGNDKDFLATRVSYELDLRGPSVTVQTACSSSLVAVVLACRALQRGECDLALAGGVAIPLPQRAGYLFEEGMILSPDGHCRPFDAAARGTRIGAGAAVVVLRRLGDALAAGDSVRAVILGAAVNNDGAGKAGYTAPSIAGQAEVIATAQALAGVPARSIGYVEAHGTGTPLGDPIEIAALTQAFRASTADRGFCRLGALKASVGHLDAAAGVAGLVKAVQVLRHRELPPLVNFREPNPQVALEESPFVVSAAGGPWPAPADGPRRAGVSSFGIGGTNAHLVLEEAPEAPAAARSREARLLVLSARSETALAEACRRLAAHLRREPGCDLADVAFTLQRGRATFPYRRAVVAHDALGAAQALEAPGRTAAPTAVGGASRPVAFLFSGQGSQHPGMGAGLYRTEPVYREAIDRCAGLLRPHLGLDLREPMLGSAPEGALDPTWLAQPALFAAEYALAALWRSWGVAPRAMVGHSIGEYVAAHLAGVFSLEDALAVVASRGRLMQALPPGAMAAVPLPPEELEPLVAASSGVEIAARNAPALCTVSGPAAAVAVLVERLQLQGVACRPLHTSHAFHSALMEPALPAFVDVLQRVRLAPPTLPWVSNVTGRWITPEQATAPGYWAEHLRRTVRFEEGVRLVASDPATLLLEVGPGTALTALARATLGAAGASRVVSSLPPVRGGGRDDASALEAAGRLWVAGAAMDWNGLYAGEQVHRVSLPTYPFDRQRHWVDAAPVAPPPEARPVEGRVLADPDQWFWSPSWVRDDPPTAPPHLGDTWLLLADPGPLADATASALASAGAKVVRVEPGDRPERLGPDHHRVRPASADDLAAVARDAAAAAPLCGAIHLWNLEAPRLDGDLEAAIDRAYHPLVALAQELAPRPGRPVPRIVTATASLQSVLDERASRPLAALALGAAVSLQSEVPGLSLRALDLQAATPPADAARQLVAEAAETGSGVFAWRGGRRWRRTLEPSPAPREALPLVERGVYLITGGLGGIGFTLARWLAERTSARLVLTGRRTPPPRERWGDALDARDRAVATGLRSVEEAGGEVLALGADVTDRGAMARALEAARARWGRLDGVIHAAGISGSGRIAALKTAAEVRAVLAPKLEGLRVLLALLGDAPLDFFALLGSVSTFASGPGVCDYTAANAVVGAFAESDERPAGWRRVFAVEYGPWQEVGMAAQLDVPLARRREREVLLRRGIPAAEGARAFGRMLASDWTRAVVASVDVPAAIREAAALCRSKVEVSPAAPSQDAVAPGDSPGSGEVERRLASIWCELLGVERVDPGDDFFELGGHSLLATRVLARVEQALGVRLGLRDVFEAPKLGQLAARVENARLPAPPPAGDDREELEF